ncbi:hypothetical protein BST81_04000 [Leptolyngbya sp. 'hensonii']|uniref:DUF3318 domain-containing protein n=1 Tax=Leptolyngbya sp. 'hensonii' TaxID=1922337 RepID=UPI00094F527D|nr:DUF3318 domain-containing protein [Leptolyngbya sp. 'hensonii']OLP19711.1 hypothetical protein BST81_04000 [Leptolyngbya sp. 'hensonii']
MNSEFEIRRLLELMPATGRMRCPIVSRPGQRKVIETLFPKPWAWERKILINFDLWDRLTKPQRDLVLLRTVTWLLEIRWFKPDLYQGLTLIGLVGTTVEFLQADAVGVAVAGTLSAIAANQIFRSNRNPRIELAADEAAIKVALRRGYTEKEAACHLISAIEAVAEIEQRSGLDFTELVRCQNLKAIAGVSPASVPELLR